MSGFYSGTVICQRAAVLAYGRRQRANSTVTWTNSRANIRALIYVQFY